MAKRNGRGREGRKRTLTKDLCQDRTVPFVCLWQSRERTTGAHMRASMQTHTSNNAFAQHPFTVHLCIFLVIPFRLSLSLSHALKPPSLSLLLPLPLIPCFN